MTRMTFVLWCAVGLVAGYCMGEILRHSAMLENLTLLAQDQRRMAIAAARHSMQSTENTPDA